MNSCQSGVVVGTHCHKDKPDVFVYQSEPGLVDTHVLQSTVTSKVDIE